MAWSISTTAVGFLDDTLVDYIIGDTRASAEGAITDTFVAMSP